MKIILTEKEYKELASYKEAFLNMSHAFDIGWEDVSKGTLKENFLTIDLSRIEFPTEVNKLLIGINKIKINKNDL